MGDQYFSSILGMLRHLVVTHPECIPFIKNFIDEQRNYSYDFNKNGEAELIKKLAVLNPRVVFDVGANVGEWVTQALLFFPEAICHCFEIASPTFSILRSTVPNERAILNPFGLSDESADIKLKFYPSASAATTTVSRTIFHDSVHSFEYIDGSVRRGDSYCKSNGVDYVDFLKVDVEDGELRVLQGFKELLDRRSVRCVQFEYGYANADSHNVMRDFFDFFDSFGYGVARLSRGPLHFRPFRYSDNDFNSGPNYIAVHVDDIELLSLLC